MRQRSLLFTRHLLAVPIMLCWLAAAAFGQSQAPPGRQQKQSECGERLVLNSSLTILENADAPIPIQHSAEDLATDFGKVFGMKPRIVHRQEDAAPELHAPANLPALDDHKNPVKSRCDA